MIQLKHIHFGYEQTELFSDVDIDIPMGRIYGLLGKNGVGKTTLLKLMTGLRFCRSGSCQVLDTNKNLNAFSFGQKKKFLLAFGLATNTRIMLLDEPTNGLDIPSKSQFRQVLASDFTDERLIIISTHQARDLEHIIDAVIILDDGTILFHELLADVSGRLAINFQSTFPDGQEALHVENVPGGYNVVTAARQDDGQSMDLELLFNTVVSNPKKVASIFTSSLQR